MLKNEYNEVHNNSTTLNDSKMNESRLNDSKVNNTKDEMIEMNDLSGGLLFGGNTDKLGKKLPPTTSKLYNPKANKLNVGLREENKESINGSHRNSDSPRSKSESANKSNTNDSSSQKANTNKTSESDKEFEKFRDAEDKKKEETDYYFKNIFIQGSFLHNFLWVDSYINPRHVRGTLWFTNTIFIWYYVAVVFNNSRDPKKVPDFDRKTRELTFDEIWVSLTAPWAAMVFVYIFCLILRISPLKLRYTKTVQYLDYVIDEYKREQVLRYMMGYFIVYALLVMVFIYVIQFTAIHGWKTSWLWWNTGSLAFFINIFIYDPLAAIIHWSIYK